MLKMLTGSALTLVSAALLAAPAAAQEAPRSTPTGLFVGAHVNSTGLTILEPRETSAGVGNGLTIGYGFTPRIALTLTGTGARVDNPAGERYTLGHVDLLARYSFSSAGRALVPYLNAGVTGRTAEFEVPAELGGGTTNRTMATLSAGGGVQYFVSPGLALDASLNYSFGNFSRGGCPDAGTEVRTCATSTRLNLGVAWYPGTR